VNGIAASTQPPRGDAEYAIPGARFASCHDLRKLPPTLAARLGHASTPFLDLAWFDLLVRTVVQPGDRVPCLVVDEASPHALALWMAQQGVVRALANYYSPLYGPIGAAPQPAHQLADALARWVRSEHRRPHMILLAPLDPDDPFFVAAPPALRSAGYLVDDDFCFANWHLASAPASFDEYWKTLDGRTRNNVERAERRLRRVGSVQIDIVDGADPRLDGAIGDYTVVYERSWKPPEPYPAFIPELCRMAAARGWLRLALARVDGRPIAAQIWLVAGARAYIYKLAYDRSMARLGAGTLLTARLMRHVLDVDRVTEVDYLAGDEPYKREWMNRRRERRGIVGFDPRSFAGILQAARHFGGRALHRMFSQRTDRAAAA
jgi:CelD/BcsL family acetyltransferase involved in cellulose biosynthesis